jgi:hypothetical protein
MVDFGELSSADSLTLETAWADVAEAFPLATGIASNVIIVGSATATGSTSSFTNGGFAVQALGEAVCGPCRNIDPGSDPRLCNGTTARYSGTALAAPQIAGLAAYLLATSLEHDCA